MKAAKQAGLIMITLFLLIFSCFGEGTREEAVTLRVDTKPLTDRFPNLGTLKGAAWIGGVIGDRGVPGPSSYYIKGFLFLSPEKGAEFKADFDWTSLKEGWFPSMEVEVPGFDPRASTWLFSREFNLFIKSASYVGRFYMARNENVLFFDIQR